MLLLQKQMSDTSLYIMKKLFSPVIISLVAFLSLSLSANAEGLTGQKSVGLRAGFTSRNTTATAGLYFSYRFTDHFRFAPKVDYAFRHNKVDAFSFNFDAEMPISIGYTPNKVNFYPIAGLNFTTSTSHQASSVMAWPESGDDSSDRNNRFGLNLGAGIEYFATPTLRLAFEAKGQMVKQFSGTWLTATIGYVF